MSILDFLQASPLALYTVTGVFGLIIGSFLNVVVHRVPKILERQWRSECRSFLELEADAEQTRYNLLTPASSCPACGHRISALQNIPVLSYLLQKGRCRACDAAISLRYPVVEILTAALFLVTVYTYGATPVALAALVLVATLIALAFIDLDTTLLPDNMTLPLLWLGLLLNLNALFVPLAEAVIGAAAGYLILWSVYQLFKLTTGKEGMGFGDFKLLAMLGAWFGWKMLPAIILLSSVAGAVIGIALIVLRGRDRNIPIPFGPYLAIAGFLALIWGESLQRLYLLP